MQDGQKTVFHESWLKDSDYSAWLGKHARKHKVRCKICPKDTELGNMGVGSLKSNAGGAKHESKIMARERHPFFHYYCICICTCKHYACTHIYTKRYHSCILATLCLDTLSWCINIYTSKYVMLLL